MNSYDDIAQHLADNLRRLRETRDWSQQQLADASGVPRPTIANLESGDGNPTLSVLLRVAQALGCSLEQLISDAQPGFERCDAESLPTRPLGDGLATVLHFETTGTEILRVDVPARGRCRLADVRGGLKRLIYCEIGKVEIRGPREQARLKAGDLIRMQGGEGVEVSSLGARASCLLMVTLPHYPSR